MTTSACDTNALSAAMVTQQLTPRDYRVPLHGYPPALQCRFERMDIALTDLRIWADFDTQCFVAQDCDDLFFWFCKSDEWAWGYQRRGELKKIWRIRKVPIEEIPQGQKNRRLL